MQFIYTPWKNLLIEDIRAARKEIFLVCPFIKSAIAQDIINATQQKALLVRTISRFAKSEFISGASDIQAHFILSGCAAVTESKFELRALSSVHAKIFIIDDNVAYVGSSNLTFSGLLRNFESTVRLESPEYILPLKQHLLSLWKSLRKINREDFVDILPKISSSKPLHRKETADRFYNIDLDLEEGESDQTNNKVLEEAISSVWMPNSSGEILSVAALLTDYKEEEDALKKLSDERAMDEKSCLSDQKHRITSIHLSIANRFNCLLENKFGVNVKKSPNRYAAIIKTPSVNKFYGIDDLIVDPVSGIDLLTIYKEEPKDSSVLGSAVFNFLCAQIAVKSGIVSKVGIAGADLFLKTAMSVEIRAQLWDHNLLGALLVGPSFSEFMEEKVRKRGVAHAFLRLVAALYTEEGINKTMDIVEEFFNPLDLIGTNIIEILDLEDPKTTLQNFCQMNFGTRPIYSDGKMVGPAHNANWEVSVTVRNLNSHGKGASLSDATSNAAKNIIGAISVNPRWEKLLKNYRISTYEKKIKPCSPLFPKANISPELSSLVAETYLKLYGLNVKYSLGYAACIDNETKTKMRLNYSNETMAWFGSHLLQVFIKESDYEGRKILTKGFWQNFSKSLDIILLRKKIGFNEDKFSTDFSQAIAAAFFFSNNYMIVKEFFRKKIESLTENQSLPQNFAEKKSYALEITRNYEEKYSYTTILQEITQAKAKTAPIYRTLSSELVAAGSEDYSVVVEGRWENLIERASGPNRNSSRNKCAFMLLKKLLQIENFWT